MSEQDKAGHMRTENLNHLISAIPSSFDREAIDFFTTGFSQIFTTSKSLPHSLNEVLSSLKKTRKAEVQDRKFLDNMLRQSENLKITVDSDYEEGPLEEVYDFSKKQAIDEASFE
mmetsp:Transcript_27437/g.41720  ORF Transcript_27437/g.41720 Transcript_27437/m.41720 type:complete len:115 (-) Transcript_27437:1095-1439(-)